MIIIQQPGFFAAIFWDSLAKKLPFGSPVDLNLHTHMQGKYTIHGSYGIKKWRKDYVFWFAKKIWAVVWKTNFNQEQELKKIRNSKTQELSKIVSSYFHDVPHKWPATREWVGKTTRLFLGGTFPGWGWINSHEKMLDVRQSQTNCIHKNFHNLSAENAVTRKSYQLPSIVYIATLEKLSKYAYLWMFQCVKIKRNEHIWSTPPWNCHVWSRRYVF